MSNRNTICKLMLILVIILFTLTGCMKFTEKLESNKEFLVSDQKTLVIKNKFANIILKPSDSSTLKMNIKREIQGYKSEVVGKTLRNLDVEIQNIDGDVVLYTVGGENIDTSIITFDVVCIVELPKKLSNIELYNENGDVTIYGDYKEISGDIFAGTITLKGSITKQNLNNEEGKIIIK